VVAAAVAAAAAAAAAKLPSKKTSLPAALGSSGPFGREKERS